MDGVLLCDKPAGVTSHDVVAEVRRRLAHRLDSGERHSGSTRGRAHDERRALTSRIQVFALVIVVGLLLVAVILPSKRDISIAAWWARVRHQIDFFARVVLAFAVLAAIVWYLVLPLLGWQLPSL